MALELVRLLLDDFGLHQRLHHFGSCRGRGGNRGVRHHVAFKHCSQNVASPPLEGPPAIPQSSPISAARPRGWVPATPAQPRLVARRAARTARLRCASLGAAQLGRWLPPHALIAAAARAQHPDTPGNALRTFVQELLGHLRLKEAEVGLPRAPQRAPARQQAPAARLL